MPRPPWMKFAILGSTYARALANAGTRAGRTFAPNAFDHIAAQPQATLKPGLSSYVREPGVLPQTPQVSAMQDLAHRLPWAGEEHTTPTLSDKAPARFDRVLEQRGLVHNTPAGQPTAQQRIDSAFGRFSDRREWQVAQRTQVPQQAASQSGDRTAVLPKGVMGIPQATPQSGDRTVVLPKGSAGVQQNIPEPLSGRAPSLSDGRSFVRPAAQSASPNKFPRARFQAGKIAAALPTAVGVGIPLAVGAGMLATKPGIQSNLHNLMAGKGTTQEQDSAGEIPDPVLQQAQTIHQHLTERGLDPRTLRIGIDAPPGSGKTTLARAIAQQTGMRHYGLDWEPGHAWKSTIGLGRNVENTPHAPRAGEILEHYLLNRTHDPELFDAQIHLRRDPNVIRQQITQRGRSAAASDFMDLDKSLQVADLGFDTLDGDEVDLGNGAVMKLRPREGWGNQLDHRLSAAGLDSTGLSRHEKLLTLHGGQRTTGAGWTPYVRNPFTPAQTFALGASVPLGVMAARALARHSKFGMVKEGIGQRQTQRIHDALTRGATGSGDRWEDAQKWLNPGNNKELANHDFQYQFSPVHEDHQAKSREFRSLGINPPERHKGSVAYPTNEIEKILTSGRHNASDVINLPFVDDPETALKQPGVYPGHVAWRGSTPDADKGTGPRWFSGVPNVSGGYAQDISGDMSKRLNAYSLSQIPDVHQGPWTKHLATDPRNTVGHNQLPVRGNSPVGDIPIYEKVIDAEHIPSSPLASYKPLPTSGKFQRVRGPNLLNGHFPTGVPLHGPTVSALERDAPGIASMLLKQRPHPKIASEKTAIGKRQTDRMEQALKSMGFGPSTNNVARPGWSDAHRALTGKDKRQPSTMRDFKRQFSPVYADPSAITRKQRFDTVEPWDRKNEIAHTEALDRLMTSGRHDRTDVVDLPFIDNPEHVAGKPGVFPDRVAWRGGKPARPDDHGARWFSGIPNASAGYIDGTGSLSLTARQERPGRLFAYELNKVPDENQGPWTQHVGVDPRTTTPTAMNAGKSDIGHSPIYEKVMDAEHVPQPMATYRPLLTPGKFLRESGPNILQRGLPAAVAPHEPTAAALRRAAPGFASRLEEVGGLLKKTPH